MSILTVDDFVSAVANNDTTKLLSFHSSSFSSASSPSFSVDDADATGDTAVEVAITTFNHKLLKLLLQRFKCNPNVSGKKNQTPLRLAARRNDTKSLELLCQFGADVNATKSGASAKHDQQRENGDDSDEDGWTPLHVAVFGMKKDAINFLLSKENDLTRSKIDFSIRTKHEGATVLHFAAAQGLGKTVCDILSAIRDQQRQTQHKKQNSSTPSSSTILNITDNNGDSVLHSALHFRMSKSLGGRYFPPEHPQWSIAMTLAFHGVDPSPAFPADAKTAHESAFYYLKQRVPAIENVCGLLYQLGQQKETRNDAGNAAACVSGGGDDSNNNNDFADAIHLVAYDDLCSQKNVEDLRKFLLGDRSSATDDGSLSSELFTALQELEKERAERNEEAKKEHLESMKQRQQQKTTGADYDKNIDPHGLGIDFRNLKPGEDPSHGECPFLAIRAAQQQEQRAKKNNGRESEEAQAAGGSGFSNVQVFGIGVVSFAIGFTFGGMYFASKKK